MTASPISRNRSLLLMLTGALALSACGQSRPVIPPGIPAAITIPGERVYPESLTSTRDGTVIIGSIATRQIFRAPPGAATAEGWIAPGTDGLQEIMGVFADDASGTLYACSNGEAPATAALYAFDLTSGAPKGHYAFPTVGGLCNDIAVGPDGTAYATDTNNMEIVQLKKGAAALTVWAGHGAFGPATGYLDGIAVLGSRVLASTIGSGRLFSVPVGPDGGAGAVTEVKLDHPLQSPDGIRALGEDSLLVAEGGHSNALSRVLARVRGGPGRLSRVKLAGDSAAVTTLMSGYLGGPVSVTRVGTVAYVLEGQLDVLNRSRTHPPAAPAPFHATAVEVGAVPEGGPPVP